MGEPVRHSYIVNGKPVFVNYGSRKVSLPPHAPNMARRGFEAPSDNDTAEAALAAASQRAISSSGRPSIQRSGSHRDSETASDSITEEPFESGSQAIVEHVAEIPIHQVTFQSMVNSIIATRQ